MNRCKHPDGCPRPVEARGWCGMHYARVQRLGTLGPVGDLRKSVTDLERFMQFTERDPVTGCLLWTGGCSDAGYGVFWAHGKSRNAHRWIFEIFYSEKPEVVMHRCDTPGCIDWESCLRAGTKISNMQDRDAKQRNARGENHGSAKVNDQQCREIRAACDGGEYQYVVAERYGISNQQVSNIVRGARRESYPVRSHSNAAGVLDLPSSAGREDTAQAPTG